MSLMNWGVKLSNQAEKDLKHWKKTNTKIFGKCLEILQELEVDPTSLETIGQPEWLKGSLSGCMSRRITQKEELSRYFK
ncbi:type II toxin-antitoxin system mRNA interferase toxin, RelE/StbE family [Candidatus Desantisbacteria bacterium CG_4_9_14_3_um_filter_40_11]|uniref:Type II toxin-antitoxin system mRNA interferase toxin, RelE/StbE family n=2 Tax=unclassified Candidatus Desantisiibacteriota TaxID=3106372 RepID=A0A2M7JCN0_9BACT|nr:MAG: type II toxin-antitoxin system mRNA interferase toxin, RelE/StbE family [Candidatus Desantisbacteria bacterium CG_4_8_14_3_um_filter_40_12]PJB29219.1 MAG: type II toxin-antitoxin system mRNA interferase toxin, RelE/StbE family [Candidatus Desantisbacteria bacterium CG_4_9_14_3_um_filter_40_11]